MRGKFYTLIAGQCMTEIAIFTTELLMADFSFFLITMFSFIQDYTHFE
jgi:hypothetical protein